MSLRLKCIEGCGALTPEQLATLRSELPPFGGSEQNSALVAEFCRFYSLDFAATLPGVEHTLGTLRSGEHTLAVNLWRQSEAKANLFIVHGYFDHTGLFNKLIEWGLTYRCNVIAFDLPGHGLSSGEPAVIDDFGDYSQAIDDVLEAVPLPELPLWAMGQSTGGAALIDYARHYSWPFQATVLLAALVRPAGWFGVQLAQRLLSPFTQSVPRSFAVNSSDQGFLEFVKNDPLQARRVSLRWLAALRRWLGELEQKDLGVGPALIIQGDSDHTVDWRYNVPVLEKLFPQSNVEYLHGAGHQLANESVEFRAQYLAHVLDHLKRAGLDLAASQS